MRQTALPDGSLDRRARPEQPAWNAADQAAAWSEPSQLVARASSGDRAAWDELVDGSQPVRRILARAGASLGEALRRVSNADGLRLLVEDWAATWVVCLQLLPNDWAIR